jgi:hypothetical protein
MYKNLEEVKQLANWSLVRKVIPLRELSCACHASIKWSRSANRGGGGEVRVRGERLEHLIPPTLILYFTLGSFLVLEYKKALLNFVRKWDKSFLVRSVAVELPPGRSIFWV